MNRRVWALAAVGASVFSCAAAARAAPGIRAIVEFSPMAVSYDASVIGGNTGGAEPGQAFWSDGVLTRLGRLTLDSKYTYVDGISGDGRVLVGNDYPDGIAVIGTRAGGLRGIGSGAALGASYDGSVVVGFAFHSTLGQVGFRWTEAGGVVPLGNLDDGTRIDTAYAVSADGNVIVGDADQRTYRLTPAGAVKLGSLEIGRA